MRREEMRMRQPIRSILLFILLIQILLLPACNLPQGQRSTPTPENLVATLVAAQMTEASQQIASATPQPSPTAPALAAATATPEATPTATPSPTASEFNVSGKVCYPGGSVPAMTLYFQNKKNDNILELQVQANQTQYQINLPPGTYQAYAWLPDFSRGGLYSNAVACGLKAGCDDHAILPFTVKEGETLQNIDLCDWYAGPFNVPYPPGKEPEQVAGAISGTISYPGSIPSLNVVAFNLSTNYWYYVKTLAGASFYTIPNLPPGDYQVVAYEENGAAGGHADASHNLSAVPVKAGETTEGVNITDWNAPNGSFPPDPTR
jgi:hypothetical protein